MRPSHWRRGVLIITGLGIAPPTPCAADSPPGAGDTLEDVIVTAQRRADRALDVPVSVSVVSESDIERLHVTNLRDLEAIAPGFTVVPGGSPGQSTIVVRGLPDLLGGAVVATLIDDAPVGSSSGWGGGELALDLLPYDIERIEILRGAQGTLYGANSMGNADRSSRDWTYRHPESL
jgi:outer membrane cobalamin receptor